MNANFTNSFNYLKHRDRYLRAARLRYLKKKLAQYPITLFVSTLDAQGSPTPFNTTGRKTVEPNETKLAKAR